MNEQMKKLEQIASPQEVAQVEALSEENKSKFLEFVGDNFEALKNGGVKVVATISLLIAFVIVGQQDANAQTDRKKAIKKPQTGQLLAKAEIPPTPNITPPKKTITEGGDGNLDEELEDEFGFGDIDNDLAQSQEEEKKLDKDINKNNEQLKKDEKEIAEKRAQIEKLQKEKKD